MPSSIEALLAIIAISGVFLGFWISLLFGVMKRPVQHQWYLPGEHKLGEWTIRYEAVGKTIVRCVYYGRERTLTESSIVHPKPCKECENVIGWD